MLSSVQDSAPRAPLPTQQQNSSAPYNYLPPNLDRPVHSIQDGIAAATGRSPNVISPIVQPLTIRSGLANPSAMLPAIPAKVRDQIKQGEFVNFNLLLPSSAPPTNDDYTIKIAQGSGDASLSLIPRNQVRPKIRTFSEWLTAWNNFIRCASFYHPHLANQFLYYQTMICQFASQYDFSSWSTYDQLFRARLVNNPVMSWDQIDEELYNRYIRGGTLQSKCFHCRNYGHYASTCPLRENMTRPSCHLF